MLGRSNFVPTRRSACYVWAEALRLAKGPDPFVDYLIVSRRAKAGDRFRTEFCVSGLAT